MGQYNCDYWGCYNMIYNFNGKVNHLKIILMDDKDSNRTTNIKLTPEGKIHVYGAKDINKSTEYMNLMVKILDNHKNDPGVIINGVRAAPKPKNRPDFTQVLDY